MGYREVFRMDELEMQIQKAMVNTPVSFVDMDLYLLCAYQQIKQLDKDLKSLSEGKDCIVSIILPDINKEGNYSRNSVGKILGVEYRTVKDQLYSIVVDFRVGVLQINNENKILLSPTDCSDWHPTDPNEILKIHGICTKLINQLNRDQSQQIRFNMIVIQLERLIKHFDL